MTLRPAACQASLSMGFSRQEYWSKLPLPTPGDLPDTGIKPASSVSLGLSGRFFTDTSFGKPRPLQIWTFQRKQFPGGSVVKRPSTMWETWIQSLGQENSLEKEMATHSSTLA